MEYANVSDIEVEKIDIKVGKDMAEAALVMPLVRQMHKESFFADRPFDEAPFDGICKLIAEQPARHCGIYVEYEGEAVAFAYFNLHPLMGSQKTMVTTMHTVYLRSDIRATPVGGYIWNRILNTVRVWSAPRHSRGMLFSSISGIAMQETDALIRGYGGAQLGGNYFMRF